MKLRFAVALVAGLPAFLPGTIRADGLPLPVRGYLCDSAAHAILFADVRARGDSEEMARDRVGRAAKAEVCGLFAGIASIVSEHVSVSAGTAYKVTAFRFEEDQRVGWLAETTFAPVNGGWSL